MVSKILLVLGIYDSTIYCSSEEAILTKNNVHFSPSKLRHAFATSPLQNMEETEEMLFTDGPDSFGNKGFGGV